MSEQDRLSRELRQRADRLSGDGHPISLDDVKRSARTMQRRQQAIMGGVAAVVLAIAVPVGISMANGDNEPSPPIATHAPSPTVATESPTTTNSPTSSPSSTPDDNTTPLTLDAPKGEAPKVSYLEGRTLHLAGGDTEQLPKAYDDVVSYHGGFLGYDGSTGTIDEIREGKVTGSFKGAGFAVSVDGTEAAWYDADADAVKSGIPSGMGEGEATQDVPAGSLATPLMYTPGSRLVYQLDDQSTGDRTIWWTDFDGRAHQIPGVSAAGGYSDKDGWIAVMTSATDDGSCWAKYSYGGGEADETLTDRTCKFSLGKVSSDGKYIIGWPAYGDGWGPGEVAILDAKTYKPVAQFDSGEDYGVSSAVWDGETDSLLADVYLDGTWQLLRLGADGSIQTASDPVKADDTSNPFRLVDVR